MGMKQCKSCGSYDDESAQFCRCCGSRYPDTVPDLGGETTVCPACSAANPKDAKFCFRCASPLTASVRCSACGSFTPMNAKFCHRCGAPTSGTTLAAPFPTVSSADLPDPDSTRKTRTAVSGFVVALLGALFLIATPLQLFGLILSICGLKAEKKKGLAVAGIVISVFSLFISVMFWVAVSLNPGEFFLPDLNEWTAVFQAFL